jgi:hypothetical protein
MYWDHGEFLLLREGQNKGGGLYFDPDITLFWGFSNFLSVTSKDTVKASELAMPDS